VGNSGILDEALDRSADPAAARAALANAADAHPGLLDRLAADERLMTAFVTVAAASRFLARFLTSDAVAIDVLSTLDERPPVGGDIAAWKRLELLRIAVRDLLQIDQLEAVGANLAQLADDVLAAATQGTNGLAVIGMGKLGGQELNYASDIDLLFVGDGDARPILEVARSAFRVDINLRPEGRSGPLTRSLDSYISYWDRWADTWEFQALLKARPSAGDPELGAAFIEESQRRLWTRRFGADELREVRDMKSRSEGEVARRGLAEREVKRGRGGIRDIEFSIQLLQMVHGRNDPALRGRSTLPMLAELAEAGYVHRSDADALDAAYRFLRNVEHRLQLVEDQQVHTIPTDRTARTHLARVLGFRDTAGVDALEQFDRQLKRHQSTARSIHERLFFRPLLEAFSGTGPMSLEAAEERLAAFGFTDADRTRQALRDLTRGMSRSSRLMQQLLPLLLGWLSEAPDPDLGLFGLRAIATGPYRGGRMEMTFRESPEAARRLCVLLGTSRLLLEGFQRQPDAITSLADDDALQPTPRPELTERASAALAWRPDVESRRAGLRRLRQNELVHIAIADVLDITDVRTTAAGLSDLAETVLGAAVRTIDSPVPLALVAMGRFGGAELTFASDLDLLVVHAGETPADHAAAIDATEALRTFVGGATPSQRIYPLDFDLRPEGKQGPLARSVGAYRTYYERWAKTWERQALLRARFVAGDAALAEQFFAAVEHFVWGQPVTDDTVREIRRMKARIERERIPAGEDPDFHLKLGRGSLSDVEWTAQLLQLQHGIRSPGTLGALDALEASGVLAADDAAILRDAYVFCERTRNRWFLVRGAPGDSLPTSAEGLRTLARSLDTTGAELRDEYRRVTRRCRTVMEQLFYGAQ
jgi:[glutamine synthetase] adenylyltransferase / [glutamine synthetase]-adenylyl-L-tyrosine phosphorylase